MSDRRIPFTAEDEDRIASASLWGIIAALTGIVTALVNAAVAFLYHAKLVNLVVQGVSLAIAAALGMWLFQAAGAFRAVARTDVADKAYLLRGFDKLHNYFMTIGVIMIVFIAAAVALFILGLVFGAARMARFTP